MKKDVQKNGPTSVIEGTVAGVHDCGSLYGIKDDGCRHAPLDKKYGVVPLVGQKLRIHVHGNEIWGMEIDGRIIFMHTQKSMKAERRRLLDTSLEWMEEHCPGAAQLFRQAQASM